MAGTLATLSKQTPWPLKVAAVVAAARAASQVYGWMKEQSVAGQTVLITGGGNGIGRLMALRLAALGARVIVWDVNGAGAEAVRDEIIAAGGSASAERVDVTDREAILFAAARAGEVDILINNAGVVGGRNLMEASDEGILRTFAVNTLAPCWTLRAFLPGMLSRNRGHIVTIASASSLIGVARLADYAASKWGVYGLHESVRMELRRRGSAVRTSVVCPFYIKSTSSHGLFEGAKSRIPWLLPLQEDTKVAEAVVRAIRRKTQVVALPPIVWLMPLLRVLLPTTLFDLLADALGINSSMDEFSGRSIEDLLKKEGSPRAIAHE